MNNPPKHHGARPPEARGPMQLHRLHRLKAGPGAGKQASNLFRKTFIKKLFVPTTQVVVIVKCYYSK